MINGMKKKFLLLASLVLVLAFGISTSKVLAAENLITNGSFENGLTGWENAYPENLKIVEGNDGHFLRMTTGTGIGPVTSQNVTGLKPNTLYTLSGQSRRNNPDNGTIDAYWGLRSRSGEISTVYVPISNAFVTNQVQLKSSETGELNVFLVASPKDETNVNVDVDNFVLTGFVN